MYFTAQAKQKYQKVCLNLIFSNWFKFSTSPASPHICNFNITNITINITVINISHLFIPQTVIKLLACTNSCMKY